MVAATLEGDTDKRADVSGYPEGIPRHRPDHPAVPEDRAGRHAEECPALDLGRAVSSAMYRQVTKRLRWPARKRSAVGAGGAPPARRPPRTGARLRRRLRSLGGVALSLALTLLGLLLVTFVIGRVMPIDPVLKVVGERATQAQYDAAYQAMGLDKPLWQQFPRYVGEVAQGNFGARSRPGIRWPRT